MGWLILVVLVGLSVGLLWLLGVRSGFLTASLAVLLLGASGYALQGRPGLAGAPPEPTKPRQAESLAQARHAFFGSFAADESWLVMSEALARNGNTQDAVGILQNAVRRYPGDAQLWVGLGNALVEHAQGLTPAAEFAFHRAAEMTPEHPGPRFFYDLALARSGAGDKAIGDLIALMREHPEASWRPMAEQLVLAIAVNEQRAKGR